MEWIELLKRMAWCFLFCVGLVLFGCSDTKKRSRLYFGSSPPRVTDEWKKDIIQNQKPKQDKQEDPFEAWPSPLRQPPGK